MSSTFSVPSKWLDVQIMEEATRNTFQVPGAPTAATFVAQTPQVAFRDDLGLALNYVTGTVDAAHVLDTLETPIVTMDIPNLLPTEGINFLKRSINLEGGVGTIEKLFSACIRQTLGTGNMHYLKLKGLMIGGGILGLAGAGNWWARNLQMLGLFDSFGEIAPTNWTFITPPTTKPLMSNDAGANHVTVRDVDAGVNYTPSIQALAVAWNRNPYPIIETGLNAWADQVPLERGVQVRYVLNRKDHALFDVLRLRHEVNSTIVIKASPPITLTVTGGKLSPVTWSSDLGKPLEEGLVHVGKSIALA